MCTQLTKRCTPANKAKTLPKDFKRIDEPFVAMEEKEVEVEKLMADMRSMGLKGDLRRRDEMTSMMEQYAEVK